MKNVRIGIIGVGNMGGSHAGQFLNGKIKRAELAAVCDVDPDRLKAFPDVPGFGSAEELIASG